jgi:hypothetical protein
MHDQMKGTQQSNSCRLLTTTWVLNWEAGTQSIQTLSLSITVLWPGPYISSENGSSFIRLPRRQQSEKSLEL